MLRFSPNSAVLNSPTLVLALLLLTTTALGDDGVTVIGERAPGGSRDFIWRIKNDSDKAITRFQAQHFSGRWSIYPEGWTDVRWTGNVAKGQSPGAGIVVWTTDDNRYAIRPGQTAEFQIRLDDHWKGLVDQRSVKISFADGTEQSIAGVECPIGRPFLARYFPLIGLGAVFAFYLLIKSIRSARRRSAPASSAAAPS